MTSTLKTAPVRWYNILVKTNAGSRECIKVQADSATKSKNVMNFEREGEPVGEVQGEILAWWVEEIEPSD